MADTIEQAGLDLRLEDAIAVLVKWRWVFIFWALLIPLIATGYSYTITPVYESRAQVLITSFTDKSSALGRRITMDFGVIGAYGRVPVYAEKVYLRSKMVLGEAIREANLNAFLIKQESMSEKTVNYLKRRKSQQDFSRHLSRHNFEGTLLIDFKSATRFGVIDPEKGYLGGGKKGQLFTHKERSFLLGEDLQSKAGDKFRLTIASEDAVYKGLSRRLNILEDNDLKHATLADMFALILIVQDNSPERAQETLDTICKVYVRRSTERQYQNIDRLLLFVDSQIKVISDSVNDMDTKLFDYIEDRQYRLREELTKAKSRHLSAVIDGQELRKVNLALLETIIEAFNEAGSVDKNMLLEISFISNPIAASQVTELLHIQSDKRLLLRRYTYDHPAIKDIEIRESELINNIITALESQKAYILKQNKNAEISVERFQTELEEVSIHDRDVERMGRKIQTNELILEFLMRRSEEFKISRASVASPVKIIQPATFSRFPVAPNRRVMFIMGIVGGLSVGVGLTILLEFLDNTIKSVGFVEKELAVPVFGMIPNFYRSRRRKQKEPKMVDGERKIFLITQEDPKSHVAEAYRSLRTNIQFSSVEENIKTILITSPGPREGKSTTIANLAITVANMGNKTLILDCDLRKPILHKYFKLEKEQGISDILSKGADWRDLVMNTEVEGCYLITSGSTPPNPAELIGSRRMDKLLEELKENYDLILIDSSPVIAVTDAVVLAPKVDASFLVFEVGRTTKDIAARTLNIFDNINSRPKGVILNNLKPEDRRAYGYGYGYGYYGGYGYGGYSYKYGYGSRYYRYYDYYSYPYGADEEKRTGLLTRIADRIKGRRS